MQEKEAKGVGEWWKGLGKEQQYALTGSLIGGGTFGALNMLRQGKRNRFKNFLSGLAVGGLGGAAAGYGGAKLMDTAKSKPQEKPGVPKGAPPAPNSVDNSNFVGVGEAPPGPDQVAEAGKAVAEKGKQLGSSGLRIGGAAGAGAVGLPVLSAVKNRAVPSIQRRWHNWGANAAGERAKVFGSQAQSTAAQLKGLYARKVLAGPNANQVLEAAAKRLGSSDYLELTKRLRTHGGFIDMRHRHTDPYLKRLHDQVQKDLLAKRTSINNNVAYLRANEAAAKADQAKAVAKAQAAAARTPTPGAATRAGFTNKTNILGLGRMRNPLLGAILGGGYQTGREINGGPDE